jgi:hypothetical protein
MRVPEKEKGPALGLWSYYPNLVTKECLEQLTRHKGEESVTLNCGPSSIGVAFNAI